MGRTGDLIFVIAVLGGIAAWVIWGWASRTRRRSEAFSPLALFSLIGFSLASLSALLHDRHWCLRTIYRWFPI